MTTLPANFAVFSAGNSAHDKMSIDDDGRFTFWRTCGTRLCLRLNSSVNLWRKCWTMRSRSCWTRATRAPNCFLSSEERNISDSWMPSSSTLFLCRFLDAFSYLYKRVCPSVGRFVKFHFWPKWSWIIEGSQKHCEFGSPAFGMGSGDISKILDEQLTLNY